MSFRKNDYLIKFVQKLLQTDFNNAELKAQLKLEIEQTSALTKRDWLLAQLV